MIPLNNLRSTYILPSLDLTTTSQSRLWGGVECMQTLHKVRFGEGRVYVDLTQSRKTNPMIHLKKRKDYTYSRLFDAIS